jgi:FlaA1/EpsC-like NDP-sugar epimerase
MDLAVNMVRLAGLVPGKDIEIRVTGLRPGEKLYEELQLDHEDILPTPHEKIMRFRSQSLDSCYVAGWVERLKNLLVEANSEELKAHLLLLVPEYQGAVAPVVEPAPEPLRGLMAPASLAWGVTDSL